MVEAFLGRDRSGAFAAPELRGMLAHQNNIASELRFTLRVRKQASRRTQARPR